MYPGAMRKRRRRTITIVITDTWTIHWGMSRRRWMPDAEVTALSQQIDLSALRAYYSAVRARTVEVVQTLMPDQLAELPDSTERRRIIDAEGIFPPTLSPDDLPYEDWSRGALLIHLAMTHNYGHIYEVCTVCSLIGIPFWG